jgi:hypothetical protein
MGHLGTLKTVNTIFAVLFYLAGVLTLLGVSLMGILTMGEDVVAGLIIIVAGVVGGVLCIVMGLLYQMTGKRLVQGRWRIMQTILALLNVTNVPIGTAYALFALWVCWMNEESKAFFEESNV